MWESGHQYAGQGLGLVPEPQLDVDDQSQCGIFEALDLSGYRASWGRYRPCKCSSRNNSQHIMVNNYHITRSQFPTGFDSIKHYSINKKTFCFVRTYQCKKWKKVSNHQNRE